MTDSDSARQRMGRRAEDRTGPIKFAITIFGGCLALGTLIWGAARISASVDNMNVAVNQLQNTTDALKNTITGILVQQARNQADIEAVKLRLDVAPRPR